MKANDPAIAGWDVHHQVPLQERPVARGARLPPPRTSEDDGRTSARQPTVLQLQTDQGYQAARRAPLRVPLQQLSAASQICLTALNQAVALANQEQGPFVEAAPSVEQCPVHGREG